MSLLYTRMLFVPILLWRLYRKQDLGLCWSTLNWLDFAVKFSLSTAACAVNFFSKIYHKMFQENSDVLRLLFQGAKWDDVLVLSPSSLLLWFTLFMYSLHLEKKINSWTVFSSSPLCTGFSAYLVFCWAIVCTSTRRKYMQQNKWLVFCRVSMLKWLGLVQWAEKLISASWNIWVGIMGRRSPAFREPWKLKLIPDVSVDAAIKNAILRVHYPVWI